MRIYNIFISLSILSLTSLFGSIDISRCKTCHGIEFEKKAFGYSKILQNIDNTNIVKMLIGYKNKTYGKKYKKLMTAEVGRYSLSELEEFQISK